jgi:hypothetical protein
MDLDDNNDEVWRSWSSEPVNSLYQVLPKDWPIFYPSNIHSYFVGWFLANYDEARSTLPEDQGRYQEKHRHGHWMQILGRPS